MSEFIRELSASAVATAAMARDEKQFFGQGWSHYETPFEALVGGVKYYLFVYNTPNHRQVNWNLKDEDVPYLMANTRQYPSGVACLQLALTPEESRSLADSIGLPIAEWLDAALESCRTDVTADRMARAGNVVDSATFHAARVGDDR